MQNFARLFPQEYFEGQVLSWGYEDKDPRHEALFELIPDPATFKQTVDGGANGEFIELCDPKPGHRLKLTFQEGGTLPSNQTEVLLGERNSRVVIAPGSRFEMDATASTEANLGYTCLLYSDLPDDPAAL